MKEYRIFDMKHRLLALAAIFGLMMHGAAIGEERSIIVASTTLTEQSGAWRER